MHIGALLHLAVFIAGSEIRCIGINKVRDKLSVAIFRIGGAVVYLLYMPKSRESAIKEIRPGSSARSGRIQEFRNLGIWLYTMPKLTLDKILLKRLSAAALEIAAASRSHNPSTCSFYITRFRNLGPEGIHSLLIDSFL